MIAAAQPPRAPADTRGVSLHPVETVCWLIALHGPGRARELYLAGVLGSHAPELFAAYPIRARA